MSLSYKNILVPAKPNYKEDLINEFFKPIGAPPNLLKIQVKLSNPISGVLATLPGISHVANRLLLVNNLYIYSKNGENVMKLPVPPESYKITQNLNIDRVNTLKWGAVDFATKLARRKVSFECLLPDEIEFAYSYLQYKVNKWKVIKFFREAQESGESYSVAITHTDIGTSSEFKALISEFSYRTEGTALKISVILEEYKAACDF